MPACIIPSVENKETFEEFDPSRPVASAAAVIRAIFLSPKRFYLGFRPEGPLREPVLFVLLVSAVSAVLRLALVLTYDWFVGELTFGVAGVAVLETVAYVVLSPAMIALFAGAYLLSVRTFVGPEGTFRGVFRILAYAYGAAILFWVPILNALAFTYVALVLVAVAFRYVYRASFLTALVTALAGYVPSALLYIFLTVRITGFAFG